MDFADLVVDAGVVQNVLPASMWAIMPIFLVI